MKDKSGYLKWGLTIFLTVCAILVFYDTFYMSGALQRLLSKLASILSPVLVGLVMAYLLAPIVNWFEKLILAGLHRIKGLEGKTIPHAAGWLRAVSILLTWAIVLLLLYLMFSVVIPQLIDSVVMLINNAETYYNKIYGWITNLLDKNPKVEDWVNENLETYYQNLLDLLTNKVLPGAQQMLTTITGGVISGIWGLVSFAMDFLVGIIVSVYMLAMKEQSLARCCKLLYGVCKEAHARWIARAVRRADGIFSGFVRGKLLDSLIIGILCLIGCTILGMPYAPLVSLIVGVTNVIPFFGPFMGAVPSAFLILLVSPKKCLFFVIFVIVLQQFDGNILGPKILGDATASGRAGYVPGRAGVCLPAGADQVSGGPASAPPEYAHPGILLCEPGSGSATGADGITAYRTVTKEERRGRSSFVALFQPSRPAWRQMAWKVSWLMSCSILQASASAVSGSTPRWIRNRVRVLCRTSMLAAMAIPDSVRVMSPSLSMVI